MRFLSLRNLGSGALDRCASLRFGAPLTVGQRSGFGRFKDATWVEAALRGACKNPAPPAQQRRCVDVVARYAGA